MVDLIDEIICGGCIDITREKCKNKKICIAGHVEKGHVERGLKTWLSSFDSDSATKCFEAVQLLKEGLENDNR